MTKPQSYIIWLETAYQLFAEEGPENFSVKALSTKCQLPRTNFYYYFNDREDIINSILELHFQTTTEQFNVELKKRLHIFIPDLYEVIYDYKLGIQFAKQLFKNRENPIYNQAHKKGLALSADLIIPKFKDYFKLTLPDENIKLLWYTLADAWYSRIRFDDYSVSSLVKLAEELWNSIDPLMEKTKQDQTSSLYLSTPLSK